MQALSSRHVRRCRASLAARRSRATPRPRALFGGLFGGKQQQQQQQQQEKQQQQQQQQQQQGQPQVQQQQPKQQQRRRRPGTPAEPEFPPYRLVKKGGAYDLRLYDPYPVVQMAYTRREEAYLKLGGYIGGENEGGARFGFTQPVVMTYRPDGGKVMSMMVGMPKGTQQQQQQQQQPEAGGSRSSGGSSGGGIASLPAPSDPDVSLGVAGGELVAVRYFEGYITPESAETARSALTTALQADGLALADDEAGGLFRVGQYGAVHTLETRTNELLLQVRA